MIEKTDRGYLSRVRYVTGLKLSSLDKEITEHEVFHPNRESRRKMGVKIFNPYKQHTLKRIKKGK